MSPLSLQKRHGVNPWIIAGTVMLATFMEVLDTSVANVALPHIAGNLSAGLDESTWILTSYLVSNAIVLPLSGWFSMIFGRKKFYQGCVFIFTLSSFLCGMAPNLPLLIIFRIMQGLGGGALQPIAQAILIESFPRKKQGMAMAVYGMGVVMAPIIGPTLGGWITDNFSWRWIFLINIPVGVASVMLTQVLVHDPHYLVRKKLREVKIDYLGLGLLSLGLGFLEIMLDTGQKHDWFSSRFIQMSAVIALVSLVWLVFWELRIEEPVVNLRLFKIFNFTLATITMFVLGGVLYGSTVLLPMLLQTLLGYTAMQSGMVLSPGGIAVIFMMPLVGFLLSRYEPRFLIMVGLFTSAAGLYHMSKFNANIDFGTAMWARVFQSLGLAFLFVPINTAAFASIPKEKTNSATGLINLARNVGGSVGIAFVAAYLASRSQVHQTILAGHTSPYDPAFQQRLSQLVGSMIQKGYSSVTAYQSAYGTIYGQVFRQARMMAFNDGFRMLAFAFLLLIPLVLMMKTKRHADQPVGMGH